MELFIKDNNIDISNTNEIILIPYNPCETCMASIKHKLSLTEKSILFLYGNDFECNATENTSCFNYNLSDAEKHGLIYLKAISYKITNQKINEPLLLTDSF